MWYILTRELRNYVYWVESGGWTDFRWEAQAFGTEQEARDQILAQGLEWCDPIVLMEK